MVLHTGPCTQHDCNPNQTMGLLGEVVNPSQAVGGRMGLSKQVCLLSEGGLTLAVGRF